MVHIDADIDDGIDKFIDFREHFHSNPELSFEEYETSKFVQDQLKEAGIEFEIKAETGVIGHIKGDKSNGKCLAIRSDLDALPILEKTEKPYSSQNEGVMHACGHDVHTSCLLSAALVLQKNKNLLDKDIKLIFQPGEEKHPGGASLLIKENVLDGVDAIIALHVYPSLPAGDFGFREGQYMASADEIYITFHGKGGHAAMPHLCVDPIVIAGEFLVGVQQVISRKKNPIQTSVLTFGKISAGIAPNVIPDKAELGGTLRCMDEEWRYQAHDCIKKYATDLAKSWGAEAEVNILVGYPSLTNDVSLTRKVQSIMKESVGEDHVKKLDLRMTAEDFSFYTKEIPGCFYRLGTNKKGTEFTAPVHNPYFDINPEAIRWGIKSFCDIALNIEL